MKDAMLDEEFKKCRLTALARRERVLVGYFLDATVDSSIR